MVGANRTKFDLFILKQSDKEQDPLRADTFDDRVTIDLGGRVVELYHFGHGDTPGDTVFYVPGAQVEWMGNLVVGEGTIPPIFEGGARDYLTTIARFAATPDVRTIIPGHGAPTTSAILARYLGYQNVDKAMVKVSESDPTGD